MKNCPNCQSVNEESFDLCWNCQQPFAENEIVSATDPLEDDRNSDAGNNNVSAANSLVVCSNCYMEVSASYLFCPNCIHQLKEKSIPSHFPRSEAYLKIGCLRCGLPMIFRGNYKFHKAENMRFYHSDPLGIYTTRESFDLYLCPKCRKIEFFKPRIIKSKKD